MDPFTIGAAALPILGGILGNSAAKKDRRAADDARQKALEQILGLENPDIQKQMLNLDSYQKVGDYAPGLEGVESMGPSAYDKISTDPQFKDAALGALDSLMESSQGNSLRSKANLEGINRDVAQQERSRRDAIMQNMNSRGVGGSGFELASMLSSNQGASDRASQAGLEALAQEEERKLMSSMNAGQLGGQLDMNSFNQQAAKAAQADAISQFNVNNRQDVLNRNTQRKNEGSLFNLSNTQNLNNSNVDLKNQQQMHNKGLYQQDFQNKAQTAGMKSNAYGSSAASLDSRANQKASQWAGVGSGAGQGLASIYSANQTDKLNETLANRWGKK